MFFYDVYVVVVVEGVDDDDWVPPNMDTDTSNKILIYLWDHFRTVLKL